MRTKPGHRDDVVAILICGEAGLREAGCRVYAVGLDPEDQMLTGEFSGQQVEVVGGLGVS